MVRGFFLALAILLLFSYSCGTSHAISKRYTYEDKTVFDLIERLNKNPKDEQAAEQLPAAYEAALAKRSETIIAEKSNGHLGDRWMEIAREREVTLQMYQAIKASPAASKVIPHPKDPSESIRIARTEAADEYYNQGMQFMTYNNRQYALQAYDFFVKADKAVPGYKDVRIQMQVALEKGTITVMVNPVRYNRFGYSYWGYQNDWMQQQMVRDLNSGSFRDTRFYSDWEVRTRTLHPDRVVDLNFTDLYIGQIVRDNYTIQRSAQVQVGTTKSVPAKPVYQTVTATVYVNRRIMESNATLECRIYEWATGRNILYDRFPDRYTWREETATYRGDQRALTPSDWNLINNRFNNNPPSRNELADRLIRNCYGLLLSRIRTGVRF